MSTDISFYQQKANVVDRLVGVDRNLSSGVHAALASSGFGINQRLFYRTDYPGERIQLV